MTAAEKEKDMEDKRTYKEAFDDFDWNKNGTIPTRVIKCLGFFLFSKFLQIFNLEGLNGASSLFLPKCPLPNQKEMLFFSV